MVESLKKLSALLPGDESDGNYRNLDSIQASDRTRVNQCSLSQVRLLTYNIFLRPPLIKTNKDDYKNARMNEFINLLDNYDIICLQEALGFWNRRKQSLIKLAQEKGVAYFCESPNPPMFSAYISDGGLLILSRLPIVKSRFRAYPYSILADGAAMKGVLYAKIAVGSHHIHVFTTHTQATHGGKYDLETYVARGDQLLAFRKFLDEVLEKEFIEGDVAMLCGDFNVDARNPYFNAKELKIDYRPLELYQLPLRKGYCNEYQSMLAILSKNHEDKIVDVVFESLGIFPPTYGVSRIGPDGTEEPDEVVLTHAVDYCTNLCLDYIFQITPKEMKSIDFLPPEVQLAKKSSLLRVKEKASRVEQFYVQHPQVTQLSDHFGLVTTIEMVPCPSKESLTNGIILDFN